jgi:hypothetical protein
LWITSQFFHDCAHGGKVNNSWYTSEILKDDTSRLERNFDVLFRSFFPVDNLGDIGLLDVKTIAIADSSFEENSDGDRKLGYFLVVELCDVEHLILGTINIELFSESVIGVVRLRFDHIR